MTTLVSAGSCSNVPHGPFRAWVPERIRRDFDSASIYNEDLALYTGYFEGRPVPAPARQLPGWHEEAVGQMAEHLAGLGFDVVDERPQVLLNDAGANDLLGALRVRRYGWETVGAVRVDEVGEIFIRVPDPSEVEGPLWQPAPDVASAW